MCPKAGPLLKMATLIFSLTGDILNKHVNSNKDAIRIAWPPDLVYFCHEDLTSNDRKHQHLNEHFHIVD